jgi:hypothetical protein
MFHSRMVGLDYLSERLAEPPRFYHRDQAGGLVFSTSITRAKLIRTATTSAIVPVLQHIRTGLKPRDNGMQNAWLSDRSHSHRLSYDVYRQCTARLSTASFAMTTSIRMPA